MSDEPKPQKLSLAVQTPAGTAYYKVADVKQLPDGTGVVTIVAGDWLDAGAYSATYIDGDTRTPGSFAMFDVKSSIEQIRFVGIFSPTIL